MDDTAAGLLLILGCLTFMAGVSIGVPRVFTEPDPQQKLRMLEERRVLWQRSQPLYALGPVIACLGVVVLAANADDGQPLLYAASALLLTGVLAWCWSVYLRTVRWREFALGEQVAWPFTTYALLTIAGLALLGAGLLAAHAPTWLGWFILVADVGFLAGYLQFRDLPPFVFYVVLIVVGVVVL
jgi:hypothetical protein